MKVAMLALLVFLIGFSIAHAQTKPPVAPPEPSGDGLGTDCAYENFFVGPSLLTTPSFTGGVTIGQYFARTLGKGVVPSPQFELGIVGPLPSGHSLDGLVSMNAMFADRIPHHHAYVSLTGGYTRMFVTGNAVNFGLGFDLGKEEYKRIVRIEVRD
jgi:hypothetical protein